MIKISVIIPCYNVGKYIKTCINSILNQTLKEIEIICIDDGSFDKSYSILSAISKKHKNVIVLRQSNQGAGAARNYGLSVANGQFVCFMDGDDWYPKKDVLETLYNEAIEHKVAVCGGSFCECNATGRINKVFRGNNRKYTFEWDGIYYYRDYQFDFGYHRFIYDLKLIRENNIQFPLYRRFQDPPFFVKVMTIAGRFYGMKKLTYTYRKGNFDKLKWTTEKLHDHLNGVTDNLEFAKKNAFYELYNLTIRRFTFYLNGIYLNNINCLSEETLVLFKRTVQAIDKSFIRNQQDYNLFVQALKNIMVSISPELDFDPILQQIEENSNNKKELPSLFNIRGISKIKEFSKSHNPKVSVIIPVYNVENYLEQCLMSVMYQTLTDIEILCVNDGSLDNSRAIVKKAMELDSRIVLIDKENGGLSSARNAGVQAAKGKYIYFLDSDDYIEDETLQLLYEKAERDKLDFLDFDAKPMFETEKDKINNEFKITYYIRHKNYKGIYTGKDLFELMMNNHDYRPSAWLHFINADFYRKAGLSFINGIIHEDNSFTFLLYKAAARCAYINKAFYIRRIYGSSLTTIPKSERNVYGYFISIMTVINNKMAFLDKQSAYEALILELTQLTYGIYEKLNEPDMSSFFENNKELYKKFLSFYDYYKNAVFLRKKDTREIKKLKCVLKDKLTPGLYNFLKKNYRFIKRFI